MQSWICRIRCGHAGTRLTPRSLPDDACEKNQRRTTWGSEKMPSVRAKMRKNVPMRIRLSPECNIGHVAIGVTDRGQPGTEGGGTRKDPQPETKAAREAEAADDPDGHLRRRRCRRPLERGGETVAGRFFFTELELTCETRRRRDHGLSSAGRACRGAGGHRGRPPTRRPRAARADR
jgi:hypothetical protein